MAHNYLQKAISLFFTLCWSTVKGQVLGPNKVHASFFTSQEFKKIYNTELDTVHLFEFAYDDNGQPAYAFKTKRSKADSETLIPIAGFNHKTLKPIDNRSFWVYNRMKSGLYLNYFGLNKDQLQIRSEFLRSLASTTHEFGRKSNLDPIINAYVNGLLSKISPAKVDNISPIHLNAVVIDNVYPNAVAYPDGTILVTTGLISMMNSESELTAILAHEVSHVIMEHYFLRSEMLSDKNYKIVFDDMLRRLNELNLQARLTQREVLNLYKELFNYSYKSINNSIRRKNELEADRLSYDFLQTTNGKGDQTISALQNLMKYESISTPYFYDVNTDPYSTHPDIKIRLSNLGGKFDNIQDTLEDVYALWTVSTMRKCAVSAFSDSSQGLNSYTIAIEIQRRVYSYSKRIEDLALLIEMLVKSNGDKQEIEELLLSLEKLTSQSYSSCYIARTKAIAFVFIGSHDAARIHLQEYKKLIDKGLPQDFTKYPFIKSTVDEYNWVNEYLK